MTKINPSQREMVREKHITPKRMVITIINGKLNTNMSSDITKSPTKVGIPTTASVLKILEPKTFPIAIPVFPFFAAFKLTITSGNEVPSATADNAITPEPIPAILDNS